MQEKMKTPHIAAALIVMLFFISACGTSEADLAETEMVINSMSNAQSTNTMSVKQTVQFVTQQHQTEVVSTAQAGTLQANIATMAFEETQQQNAQIFSLSYRLYIMRDILQEQREVFSNCRIIRITGR